MSKALAPSRWLCSTVGLTSSTQFCCCLSPKASVETSQLPALAVANCAVSPAGGKCTGSCRRRA